jgi:hypothetical protein
MLSGPRAVGYSSGQGEETMIRKTVVTPPKKAAPKKAAPKKPAPKKK